MELATALHHSAQRPKTVVEEPREVEAQERHSALRGQIHWGVRLGLPPGLPPEPSPQRSDRTVRHSSGDSLPQLVTPSLAGAAGEGVDSATLAFLLSQSLAAKEKEEQEKREEEAKEDLKAWTGLDGPPHALSA